MTSVQARYKLCANLNCYFVLDFSFKTNSQLCTGHFLQWRCYIFLTCNSHILLVNCCSQPNLELYLHVRATLIIVKWKIARREVAGAANYVGDWMSNSPHREICHFWFLSVSESENITYIPDSSYSLAIHTNLNISCGNVFSNKIQAGPCGQDPKKCCIKTSFDDLLCTNFTITVNQSKCPFNNTVYLDASEL